MTDQLTTKQPLLTVIIPTYNRSESLEACLAALAKQDLPLDDFEVVVVDDGGDTPLCGIVERFGGALNLRLLVQANAGPAAARNAGAHAARGRYLVFTDDDCQADSEWLSALAVSIAQHPRSAVGGRVVNALGGGLYSSTSQLLVEFLYSYYNADQTGGRFFITANLAFPAAAFAEVGGFDASFPLAAAEDRDMCDRWRAHGYEMVYAEGAVVRHAHALALLSFCRQHFNYGRGAYHLHRARSRRGEAQLRIEPMHFYSRLIGYPFSKGRSIRAVTSSLLLLLSQVVYIHGYFLERAVNSPARAIARKSVNHAT